MAKQPKLTKKMLNNLDRAEVRTILMVAMGVKPETAYQQNEKWCIDHIYNNQQEFAEADIQSIGETRFRKGVFSYVNKMQAYLLGKSEAPAWPPEIEADDLKVVDTNDTAAEAAPNDQLLIKDSVDLDQSINVKSEEVDEASDSVAVSTSEVDPFNNNLVDDTTEQISARGKAIEAPLNTGASIPSTVAFRKVKGLMKKGSNGSDAVEKPSAEIDYDYFDESFVGLGSQIEAKVAALEGKLDLNNNISLDLHTRMASVENALLFIINSAILPEDQMVSNLDQLPSPPYE